jgi:hypothetical protein
MVLDLAEDREEVVVVRDEELIGNCPDAARAQCDLIGRFLAGGIEHGTGVALREGMCDRQEQRGLAYAGLACDEHDLAGDEPATHDSVELPGTRGDAAYALLGDTGDGLRRVVTVGAISTTVPNSWHLGQRPTQRSDVAPHALHW